MNRLTNVKAGKRAVLVSIDGGRCAEMRLAEMGFLPGVEIQVINNSGIGPLTVNIKGTKMALGHGLARKILVKEEQQCLK
ncbi:MAG TPA: ferrous iron transport protein A [Deltaproteobacteria bacterium]|nr:ferrous iron transport protein A [Deltaproteobacteria bacterium]